MGVSKNREVVLAWTRRGRLHELLRLLPELRDRLRPPLEPTVAPFVPQLRMSADGVPQVPIPASAAAAAAFVPSSSPPLAGASSAASSAGAVAPQAAAAAAPVAEAERSRPKRNVRQTEKGAEMAAEKKTAKKADGKKFKAAASDKLPGASSSEPACQPRNREGSTWLGKVSQCRSTSMVRGRSLCC
jgi:hypothetical protein